MIDFGDGVSLRTLIRPSIACRNDPRIWRWTRQNDLISQAEQNKWFVSQAEDPTIKMYGVFNTLSNQVGVCGLTSINLKNRNAEFSLYILPSSQGKGLGKASLLTLFRHGFRNMGLRSIWGETFDDNPAQKLFREIGMHEDGRRREFYWKDGKYCDAILFSIMNYEFAEKHTEKSCF